MVENIAGVDGSQICDEQAGMEGAQVDDLLRQQAVKVQVVGQPEHKPGQPRDGEGDIGETAQIECRT